MAEPTTRRSRRRPRRSTRVSQKLARMRQANAEQRAEQMAQEQRVDAALQEFADAVAEIEAIESACEEKVAPLQRKIDEIRASARDKIEQQHRRQATSALVIHTAERTVSQVGDLLEVSEREARRLISAGRRAADNGARQAAPETESTALADRDDSQGDGVSSAQPAAAKQQHLGGVDRRQDSADSEFVPAVEDGRGRA